MSEDISYRKKLDGRQDIEYRDSSVDYEEYLNNVQNISGFENRSTESKNCAQPTAEDEVTAILLSAMMGSIVKYWEKPNALLDKYSSHFFISENPSEEVESARISPDFSILKQNLSKYTIDSQMMKQQSKVTLNSQILKPQQSKVTLYSQITPVRGPVLSSKKKTKQSMKSFTDSSFFSLSFHLSNRDSLSINAENSLGPSQSQSKSVVYANSNTKLIQNFTREEDEEEKKEESPLTQLMKLRELLVYDKENCWEFLDSGEEFVITFKQGNRYEGKLLNCRMHGKGKFHWADDGSIYEGNFLNGKMIGQGKMNWSDQSWYEGEFNEGFRHGRGLYVDQTTFYAGYWKHGSRHGVGVMYYNKFDTKKDYYNGEWLGDLKHYTGLRSYPSGAMYSGQWSSGKRHGLGTMVWTDGDVYSGNYDKGKMHGYGEYTWDTFYNQQLVIPEENCYYGEWVKNIRHGNGTLETSTGVIVKGSWKKGKKHGPAEVVCSNGNFLYADNLFEEDRLCLSTDNSVEADSLNASVQSLYRLPVSAAPNNIELGYYVNRLAEFANESCLLRKPFCKKPNKTNANHTFDPDEYKFDFHEEENHLRNVIMQFTSPLKVIYNMYAQVCCDVKPTFPTVLIRLMWWQLLRDCDLHSKGFSLAHFDTCIANNKACLVQSVHYPFEKVLFWQFLHFLIEVSWELYTKNLEGTSSIKGIISSGLHKLITGDLIPNAGRHKGIALFKCKDLMSLDSLYSFYREVGEPHSARDFLKRTLLPQENDVGQKSEPTYPEYKIRGKNIFGVGGKLTYFPNEEPLLTDSKYQYDQNHPKNLSCLSSLGLLGILECILQVCKSISMNGLLVNMDYKIVFLEFYEILLLCALTKARKRILARKKKEEEEKPQIESPENNSTEDQLTNIEEVPPSPDTSSKPKKSSQTKKTKKKK